jgi:pimeloyl-ACP methyl ester carboxylesterase
VTVHVTDGLFSAGSSSAASFIPGNPERVLVLAHGFPWPDESMPDSALVEYARAAVERWIPFAETYNALVVAPVFGGQDFPLYREMLGRVISPAEFVNQLVQKAVREHVPRSAGRFSLHGHSAGAQFAARYLVSYPHLLDQVVLSAPSTFPVPDTGIPWPYGMAPAVSEFAPKRAGWLAAASEVPVTVLVGSQDTEPRPPAPGQPGSTRIERAAGWVESMRRHAEACTKASTIRLVLAEGLDHDEEAMAVPAREILARGWRGTARASD